MRHLAVSVRLGLESGGNVVAVNEAGGPSIGDQVLLFITVQGERISDIPIRILPLTYNEFDTMLSSSLLNELFPARPINAAMGNYFYCVMTNSYYTINRRRL